MDLKVWNDWLLERYRSNHRLGFEWLRCEIKADRG